MRKLIGKIIIWALKDQVIKFTSGQLKMNTKYSDGSREDNPTGQFKVTR